MRVLISFPTCDEEYSPLFIHSRLPYRSVPSLSVLCIDLSCNVKGKFIESSLQPFFMFIIWLLLDLELR